MARLKQQYREEFIGALRKTLSVKNEFEIPRISKIVLNVGLGDMSKDAKVAEAVMNDMTLIAGQKPVFTRAKKAISNFHIRENDIVGCRVTLRREQMFEFLDKLINVAIPRIRDFRGVSSTAFDGSGNYTLGVQEQIIFPEVPYDKVLRLFGFNVTIVTSTKSDEKSLELLKCFGMPFRTNE